MRNALKRNCPNPLMHVRTTWGGELRHPVAITRCSGRRCRNSEPEDQPSVVRNSQQNSQRERAEKNTHSKLTARDRRSRSGGGRVAPPETKSKVRFMCTTIS